MSYELLEDGLGGAGPDGTGGSGTSVGGTASSTGGSGSGAGGSGPGAGGSASGTGGSASGGGGSGGGTGGSASGGGGSGSGTGGSASGGASSGGAGSGGASSGGAGSGGAGSGGASSGGASSGGASSGGASSGGAGSGGAGSGGAGSGGSGGSLVIDYPVTTTADEDDPGATVGSPGQTGLSLREAMDLANGTPGSQTIGLDSGSTYPLDDSLPIVTEGLVLAGQGASLDFSPASGASPCLHLDASDVSIQDLEISGCNGEPVYSNDGAATGLELLRCYIHDSGQGVSLAGTGTLIQGNRMTNSGTTGLTILGPSAQIRDNEILDSSTYGIYLSNASSGFVLVGNLVVRSDVGLNLGVGVSGGTLWFNTVEGSSGFGISVGLASGLDFRNNIVTGGGSWGLNATDARFTVITHNLLFGNASGGCNNCTPGAPYLTSDPQYANAGADDYSLGPTSPALNAGVDVGEDRNGASGGNYDGAAPDLGYLEAN